MDKPLLHNNAPP
jgi:hypothetical protein